MALPEAITYDRAGRVTEVEQELKYIPGALYTVRNMLGVDPDGGGVPDATETVKGKAELATVAEAVAGTDTTRIVTPAGLAAAIAAAGSPIGSPIILVATVTTTTVPGGTVNAIYSTLSGAISISRTAQGTYDIISTVAEFTTAMTLVLGGITQTLTGQIATAFHHNTTTIRIVTRSNVGTVADQNIAAFPLLVLAYPSP